MQGLIDLSDLRWVNQRHVAGKPLAAQAVIRAKFAFFFNFLCLLINMPFSSRLATMMARVESLQSWLENITYQMNHMVMFFNFCYL